MLNACGERMLASQTLNKELAREISNIRSTAENAYREFLGINSILKRNTSSLESFEGRLNEFAFLSSLEEKFKYLSVSLNSTLSSFSSKIDCFFTELSSMKKSLEEQQTFLHIQERKFLDLYDSFIFFQKTIETKVSNYIAAFEQKTEISKKFAEKLGKDFEDLFAFKDHENKQKNKDLVLKIVLAEETSKSLLDEIRKLKVIIRVLENKFDTLRNKEKG